MLRHLRHLCALALLAGTTLSGACSQTPVLVPLRSMERPKDVDFICLHDLGGDHWVGASLEKCAVRADQFTPVDTGYRLHAVVTQTSRGELAVADVGTFPTDVATLLKVDPRIPGYSFLPVGAVPSDVVADPAGKAVYVASGRDARIDIIPAELLRGPIDTTAEQGDQGPWPHIALDPVADGVASSLAIIREGESRKLYVVLADPKDATGNALPPKIAVYDLGLNGLTPTKIGDIALDLTGAPDLPWAPLACGPTRFDATANKVVRDTDPWWAKHDRDCFGATPAISSGTYVAPAAGQMHIAGIAVVNRKIFAADDKSPVIHVFDADTGREERRIPIGSPTSRLALSPPVPDEVDLHTVRGVDICQELGFLGDGLDHSDNATIKATLGGFCRLHRYLYAIDFFNPTAGNGSVAIVDLPVTYPAGVGGALDRAKEKIDFGTAQLVQPMACDSPNLPATRLPLGPFGVGGLNAAPARAITFLTIDPPTPSIAIPAARCRGWDRVTDKDKGLVAHPDGAEFGGVSTAAADVRTTAGEYWRDFVAPGSLRGTFAFVALENGSVAVVDIDDYDATCRGPVSAASVPDGVPVFGYPTETAPAYTIRRATGEYYPRVVSRHRPRSLRLLDLNALPAISSVSLSRFGVAVTNDPTSTTGVNNPHFAPMGVSNGAQVFALPSADNPFTVTSELWTVTYEGQLPGRASAVGNLTLAGGELTLGDPSGGFCQRGAEDTGAKPESHDVIELVDDVCTDGVCRGGKTFDECRAIFGDGTETPPKKARSLYIAKAFDDKVTLAPKHWGRPAGSAVETLQDGYDLEALKSCFGVGDAAAGTTAPLHRYVVRATGSWVVLGGLTGYMHRRIVDPASPDKACIDDPTRPHVYDGRVRKELPPLADPTQSFTSKGIPVPCDQYVNPSWRFAIRAGKLASERDMQFSFGSRFAWTPFAIGVGQIPQTVKPMSVSWDGEERLNWSMIAVVDAVERGLYMFTAQQPFTFQKSVN